MVFAISRRACVRNIQMMLVLGLMWLVPLGAGAQSLPTIEVCNDCSTDLQYSQAAFSATDLFPGQSEDVYVVNVSNEQTRVFRVTLMIIGGFGDTSFDVNVTEISGNPAVLGDIAAATTIFKDFNDALIQDIDAEDLDLSFDSALDLIDTEDLPARGFRRELQEELTEFYGTTWRGLITEISNIIDSIIDRFLADIGIDPKFVTVVFEDGTKVRLRIEEFGRNGANPSQILFEFEVDVESITAPGLNFVPLEPDDFLSLIGSGLDNDLAQELRDLAFRFGIPVVGPDDAGGCATEMTCGVGVDGEPTCNVTPQC